MFDLPNFANFVAGSSVACIGAVVFSVLFHSGPGERYASDMGADLINNGSRFVAGAYALIAIWIAVRLVINPTGVGHWGDSAEMGWMFLIATALSSAAFFSRSALSKLTLGLSIIGLCAMAYVTWPLR